jgi:hypothetical protein
MPRTDGGSAFPLVYGDGREGEYAGMSLRDYFAAQALAGFCGNGGSWPKVDDGPELARRSYLFADAMLAERERG